MVQCTTTLMTNPTFLSTALDARKARPDTATNVGPGGCGPSLWEEQPAARFNCSHSNNQKSLVEATGATLEALKAGHWPCFIFAPRTLGYGPGLSRPQRVERSSNVTVRVTKIQ